MTRGPFQGRRLSSDLRWTATAGSRSVAGDYGVAGLGRGKERSPADLDDGGVGRSRVGNLGERLTGEARPAVDGLQIGNQCRASGCRTRHALGVAQVPKLMQQCAVLSKHQQQRHHPHKRQFTHAITGSQMAGAEFSVRAGCFASRASQLRGPKVERRLRLRPRRCDRNERRRLCASDTYDRARRTRRRTAPTGSTAVA
jgi:hypothetical protein